MKIATTPTTLQSQLYFDVLQFHHNRGPLLRTFRKPTKLIKLRNVVSVHRIYITQNTYFKCLRSISNTISTIPNIDGA